MAPEVIYQHAINGYSDEVDLWSFGCFIHELLVGHTPFASEDSDTHPLGTYQRILRGIRCVDLESYIPNQPTGFGGDGFSGGVCNLIR